MTVDTPGRGEPCKRTRSRISSGPDVRLSTVKRLAVATAASLVSGTLAACSGGLSTSASLRSTQAFCEELTAGNDRMRENYEAGGDTTEGQLASIFVNVGEFTQLVHRLDERAPEEIETEMHDARGAWDKQADLAQDAASDPVGALAGGLMRSMMSGTSMRAVDAYAQTNCDMQLFGTSYSAASNEPLADPTTSWTCETASSDARPDLLAAATSVEDLADQLGLMTQAAQPGVAAAAQTLLDDVATLDPAPESSREAFGRMSFTTGTEDVTHAGDLFSAVLDACPDSEMWASQRIDEAASIGPRFVDGELSGTRDLYRACDNAALLGFPDANTYVSTCDADIAHVDLTTGGITWFSDAIPPLDEGENTPALSGRTVAWATTTEYEADGLTERTYDADLSLLDLDSGQTTTMSLVSASAGEPPDVSSFAPEPDTSGFSVVVTRYDEPAADWVRELLHVDTAGTVAWRMPVRYESSAAATVEHVTAHTAVVDYDNFVDMRTGELLADYSDNPEVATDKCERHASLTGTSEGLSYWVSDVDAEVRLTRLSPKYPIVRDDFGNSWTTSTGAVIYEGDGARKFTPPDGDISWQLPEGVVAQIVGFGRWVVVTNESDELVLVDAATGQEAISFDVNAEQALLAGWDPESGIRWSADHETAWLAVHDDAWARISAADLCGTGAAGAS